MLPRDVRTALIFLAFLLPACAVAQTAWISPTPEELAFTSEPKAPGASVIFLSYNETDDADSSEVTLHVRLKVLTAGGLSAGTITLPERSDAFNGLYQEIYARTIHRDGTVIPFTGTPHNSIAGEGTQQPVISLSGVEVGSILEYVYHFYVRSTVITRLGSYSPFWFVQQPYYIRSAHFSLKPPANLDQRYVRWVAKLPPRSALQYIKGRVVLDLTDIPAAPVEELAPPTSSTSYNVRFFYYDDTRDKYWSKSGGRVDAIWSSYDDPRKALVIAVQDLVQPTDTDEQKLRKIYAAVMQFENTDFTRAHQQQEDKKNGLRSVYNSEDLWLAKRGDSSELTLLFIALARAAGFPAYPMAVASRGEAVFDQEVLSWSQLDSMIAIVNVKGKEVFFDPGARFCPFARMAPWHANVIGVSSEGKLIKMRYTPAESNKDARIDRSAELILSDTGKVTGTITINWSGTSGLLLRQHALLGDQHEVESNLKIATQSLLPSGIELELTSLTGLADGEQPLVATFNVTGNLGTKTSKRLFLPSQFFESTSKPLLETGTRTLPINFPMAYGERDVATFHIPENLTLETFPEPVSLSVKTEDAIYKTLSQSRKTPAAEATSTLTPSTIITQRIFILKKIDYVASDYPELHKYFGQIASEDHSQIVLRMKSAGSAPP